MGRLVGIWISTKDGRKCALPLHKALGNTNGMAAAINKKALSIVGVEEPVTSPCPKYEMHLRFHASEVRVLMRRI